LKEDKDSLDLHAKLRIASFAMPILRNVERRPKNVTITDGDGVPLRMADGSIRKIDRVALSVARMMQAGIDVSKPRLPSDGKRPQATACRVCLEWFKVPKKGRVPKFCSRHVEDAYRCTHVEDGRRCEKQIDRHAWQPRECAARRGALPICLLHANLAMIESRTPEQSSALYRKARLALAAIPPEQRSESTRKGHATRRANRPKETA
jgi:hypothetical protein